MRWFLKVNIEIDENEAIEEILKVYLKEKGAFLNYIFAYVFKMHTKNS